jgi:hypothetical protein
LMSGIHLRSETNFFLPFSVIIRQFQVCWCWAHSQTRVRACSLQLLLGLASAFSGPTPRPTHDHILLSQIWDSSNRQVQFPVFLQEQGSLGLPPGIACLPACFPASTTFLGDASRLLVCPINLHVIAWYIYSSAYTVCMYVWGHLPVLATYSGVCRMLVPEAARHFSYLNVHTPDCHSPRIISRRGQPEQRSWLHLCCETAAVSPLA